MRFKIYRYNESLKKPRYDVFNVKEKPGMTILSALFNIQENLDDSLSFRYSCRGAVCGSCAMLINKIPRLACRTQVSQLTNESNKIILKPYPSIEIPSFWNQEKEILIEPLPHLKIIKDLIVNMDKFYKNYNKIEPIFKSSNIKTKIEQLMSPEEVNKLEKYTNCILCAACYGACPVNAKNDKYLGPAALAKLFRFYLDPRENDHKKRLLNANNKTGWWACEFKTNCKLVCPKGVTPNIAIGIARNDLIKIDKKPEG